MKKIHFPRFSEKMKRWFLAGACGVLMIFISIMAYFTSTEQVTNRFTVGDIKIDLVEPSFPGNADPVNIKTNYRLDNDSNNISYADANYILPGELVPKDPKIVNTGKNEAIVFMKVEIPTYTDVQETVHEVFVVSNNTTISNNTYVSSLTPTAFSSLNPGDTLGTNNNWIYLGKAADSLDTANGTGQNNTHTYIFGYKTILNPEYPDEHIDDGKINSFDNHTNADKSVKPFQTENLFNYVMLNPDLNGADPYEGQTFYNQNGTAVSQDIKIYAYGVQSQFLRNSNNSTEISTVSLDKDKLISIWETAGFGGLANNKVPDADNHNKYGIPADPADENYPKNGNSYGNAWTNADGDVIVNNSKKVLTRTITYYPLNDENGQAFNNDTERENSKFTVTYKKIEGSTGNWIGWYPDSSSGVWTCSEIDEYSHIQNANIPSYLNEHSGNLVIRQITATTGESVYPNANEVNPLVDIVTVNFGNIEKSAKFTKIGSTNYEMTSGSITFPSAANEYKWSTATENGTDITSYETLIEYLNDSNTTITNNTVTLYQVTAATPDP